MKICLVTSNYPSPGSPAGGGIPVYVRDLAVGLALSGNGVQIFCFGNSSEQATEVGVEINRVGVNDDVDSAWNTSLKVSKPDIIHIHSLEGFPSSIVGSITKHKIPYIITLHDHLAVCPMGQRWWGGVCDSINESRCVRCVHPQTKDSRNSLSRLSKYWIAKKQGKRMLENYRNAWNEIMVSAEIVLAPSNFHKHTLTEYGFDEDHICVQEYGYPLPENVGKHTDSSSSDIPFRFGFIGSLIPPKGLAFFA